LAELPRVAGEALKHVELCNYASKFARLKDTRHPPHVVHQLNCVSDCELFLFGVIFVNDNVIVTLKRASFDEPEAATQLVELSEINAREGIKAPEGLNHSACSEYDMWLFHEER
jgi:hypothetical protein